MCPLRIEISRNGLAEFANITDDDTLSVTEGRWKGSRFAVEQQEGTGRVVVMEYPPVKPMFIEVSRGYGTVKPLEGFDRATEIEFPGPKIIIRADWR